MVKRMQKLKILFKKISVWRLRKIPQDKFILLLSIIVGFASGLGAVILKHSTHFISSFLKDYLDSFFERSFDFLYPVFGISISLLISKFLIGRAVGHGIPNTLYAISKKGGVMSPFQMIASVLTAPFTVGFGGSVGLEGPTVATGASLGSNIARLFHLDTKMRILMIGAAACGAMSSIFKAPIAAIIFAIEVFSLDLTLSSLLPLLLASTVAYLTSLFFMGNEGILYFFPSKTSIFALSDTWIYISLGAFAGLVSIYFSKCYLAIESFFEKIDNTFKRLFIGGLFIALLMYFIPPLYGEGFTIINSLLAGDISKILEQSFYKGVWLQSEWFWVLLLLGLVLFKIVATATTFGAGGVGGIFAPTLFMGSAMGFLFAKLLNILFPALNLSESHMAMIGMGSLMSGVLFAPLTSIFLIAELTGGYQFFIPLMISSGVSFVISRSVVKYSIYAIQLAKRGELLTHDKDQNILRLLSTPHLIEVDFVSLSPYMKLKDVFKKSLAKSRRNLFPVVDPESGKLVGIITLDDFRHLLFEDSYYEMYVERIMHAPPDFIRLETDSVESIMMKFNRTQAWNLPVVEHGLYKGFISRSKLLTAYRKKLIEVTYS